jgi:hypothetical protein
MTNKKNVLTSYKFYKLVLIEETVALNVLTEQLKTMSWKIGICSFPTKQARLRRKNKDSFTLNQDKVSKLDTI